MIYRCDPHPTPYQIIGKNVLNDERLSPEALGVITYLLGRPKNWNINVPHLAKRFHKSKDSIGKIFKELEQYGYARLAISRRKGETKFRGKQWEVFESPDLNPDWKNESPTVVATKAETSFSRQSEKADVGENRPSEKPTLLNKREEENKEFHLKNNERVKERADGTTHTQFFKNEVFLNEKNVPSPQISAAPPFPAADDAACLFRQSIYATEPEGFDQFCSDLIARGEHYAKADLNYYYRRVKNWSDSKNAARADWIATAAGIIESDHSQNKLKTSKNHEPTTIDGLNASKVLRRAAQFVANNSTES